MTKFLVRSMWKLQGIERVHRDREVQPILQSMTLTMNCGVEMLLLVVR